MPGFSPTLNRSTNRNSTPSQPSPYVRPSASTPAVTKTDPATGTPLSVNYGIVASQPGSGFQEDPVQSSNAYNSQKSMLENAISGLSAQSSFGGAPAVGSPTGLPARASYNGGGGSAKAALDAAQSAAFGAAKSKAGALARSSVDSMRGELAGRGIVGGGTEARGLMSRISAATNPLSDINVAQLGEQSQLVQHEGDMRQHAADTQFSGDIAQRGQDIQGNEAAGRMNLAQQQLAQQKQMSLLSLQQALAGLSGRY